MITIKHRGDFKSIEKFFEKVGKLDSFQILDRYAQEGVKALSSATPVDTSATANAWGYEIVQSGNSLSIFWTNSNINNGVNIAIILQYGHGTRNGGYVQGRDYINPAILPIFDKIADEAWKEVTTS
jgi:hypothetical protein